MPRGVPITPERVAEAAAEYARTGNYAAAARAIGEPETTVRLALQRAKIADRSGFHARALDRGLREGRRALRKCIAKSDAMLDEPLEPKDLASVSQAISHSVQRLSDLRELPARRAKIRAETRVADAKAKGLLPPEHVTLVTDPAAVNELFRRTFGFEGAKGASDDASPATSVSDVGGEALSLPASVDRRGE